MIGTIVVLGAFSLVDIAVASTQKDDRAAHRDRRRAAAQAMEDITRQLRSQICLGSDTVPIIEATPTSVVFYASLAPRRTTSSRRARAHARVRARLGGRDPRQHRRDRRQRRRARRRTFNWGARR